MTQPITFSDDETQKASEQEEQERAEHELQYLTQRVTLLRALVNRQAKELSALRQAEETDTGEGVQTE